MSGQETANILVVDDDRSMREFLEILLTGEGYSVTLADSGESGLDAIKNRCFDLVVTDIRMKGVNGLDVLRKAKEANPDTMVVMISAFATADTAVEAMREGAHDYIPKPFKVREFKKIIKDTLESRRNNMPAKSADHPDTTYNYHFDCLIGESPQMKKAYDLIEKVAGTKSNILITGESGTGKELAARAIHNQSPRKDRPFVVINCAGIPETLIESELFGYKKGAFTGAVNDKIGLFEVAQDGTVFLDEVGELTPAIQVKLLRVIQERTFTAVGGTEEKKVDVRVISATNKTLENEVVEKRFREDLFFRLNVIQIVMPPLRKREGDIDLLSRFFLDKYSNELGKDVKKISAYALDLLKNYSFPGNVRELENIIERSVALEASNIVLPESLTLSYFYSEKDAQQRRRQKDLTAEGINLNSVMTEIEKEYLLKAIEMAKGSKQKAADLLGLTLDAMKYRFKKLGI